MNAVPCLHFLCGKAGAGKSTLALSLAAAHNAILISEDIWLTRLYGDRMKTFDDYRTYSQRARTVAGPLVVDVLRAGQSVVMDYPASTNLSRAWFRSLYQSAGAAHVLHYMDTPDATCLKRIERRNVERPEGSFHVTRDDFVHVCSFFEAPDVHEGFTIELHVAGG